MVTPRGTYGAGSIKRRGNSWQLRWHDKRAGRYCTKTLPGNMTEAQARKELRHIQTAVDEGTHKQPIRLTVADGLRQYLEHIQRHVRAKTFQEYEGKIQNHLIPGLGNHRLDSVKPMQIQEWFDKAIKSGRKDGSGGLSIQSLVHIRTLLRAAFQYLVDNEQLSRNPAGKVKLPDVKPLDYEILTEDEILTVLEKVQGTQWETPVWLAIFLGARRGEVLALTWDDVDLENKTVRIAHSLSEIRGVGLRVEDTKTSRIRIVAIGDTVVDMLKQHRERQEIQKMYVGELWQGLNLVCCNETGGFLWCNKFTQAWREIMKTTGIKKHIRLHDCRHTHNSILMPYIPVKVPLRTSRAFRSGNDAQGLHPHQRRTTKRGG